ncbi:hypothetical protein [Clostridium taeniosporum]|uniref:Lipoprotein n=1 Tax=Clostridium taeniosporum TaxID=394958 RepID=A0A1D7XKP6_9CLOT|nr:hypothetical protein [Clostridium taeniosporum]AOR23923.1 hypothetical protein BGI42_09375 [Clostridium taeniosporum]
MYIKNKGNIIISTMLTFSVIMLISSCSFILMKNNNEISHLYNDNGSIYNLFPNEEDTLLKLNTKLNKLKNKEIFIENFNIKDNLNELRYEIKKDKFYLLTDQNTIRELKYICKENKIYLIPTYKNMEINYEF